MKRMAIMITAAALACTAGAVSAGAAGQGWGRATARTVPVCRWLTEDGNSLGGCRTGTCRYDTDSLCDRNGCGGFVDENGDGLCDNRPAGGCRGRWAAQQ